MRRKSDTPPLSPELLRQFALITLIITAVIAMFVSGEHTQVQAAIQAREAKNRLIATEADKIGARKVSLAMKVEDNRPQVAGFETLNDRVETFGGREVSPSPGGRAPPNMGRANPYDPRPSFAEMSRTDPKASRARRDKKTRMTDKELAAFREASRLRSSQGQSGD